MHGLVHERQPPLDVHNLLTWYVIYSSHLLSSFYSFSSVLIIHHGEPCVTEKRNPLTWSIQHWGMNRCLNFFQCRCLRFSRLTWVIFLLTDNTPWGSCDCSSDIYLLQTNYSWVGYPKLQIGYDICLSISPYLFVRE